MQLQDHYGGSVAVPKRYGTWDYLKTTFLIPLCVNLFAAAIAYFYTLNFILVIGVLIGGLLAIFTGFLGLQWVFYRRIGQVSIKDIIPYTEGKLPIDILPIDQRIDEITERFLFMGVSAKILWDTRLFEIMSSYKYRSCSFRFLLLDPQGDAVQAHCARENIQNVDATRLDIESVVTRITEIKRSMPNMQIDIRYYNFSPPFWLMLCNDNLYVQTYPKGDFGRSSPLILLQKESPGIRGFFEPFMLLIEEIWSRCARRIS